MSRYNTLINTHFSGCRLLAEGHDQHRNRPVKVFMIPGDFTIVGITDTVDSWIAPTSVAPSDLFDKVRRVLHDFQNGKNIEVAHVGKPRIRVAAEPQQQTTQRPRKTIVVDEAPTTTTRRRIHVHS